MKTSLHCLVLAQGSSPTPSPWPSLIIAIVGVFGTLFAAVFTQIWQSRLETARWRREQERTRAQWMRESSIRYYEQERNALVSFFEEWQRLHVELWPYAKGQRDRSELPADPIASLHPRYLHVEIFGTPDARKKADACMASMRDWIEAREDQRESASERVGETWSAFTDQVRSDLGVTAAIALRSEDASAS